MLTWIVSPFSQFFSPLQGVARLYPYIRNCGHDVHFKDFNQNAFFSLMSKKYIEDCFDKLQSMLFSLLRSRYLLDQYDSILFNSSRSFFTDLMESERIDFNESFRRKKNRNGADLLLKICDDRERLTAIIDRSSALLDSRFLALEPNIFLNNYAVLLCGKALYDAIYFPTFLDFGFGFHNIKYGFQVNDVCSLINDDKHNYLIRYFSKEALPLVDKEQPGIIGISITHSSELLSALTLCNLVKAKFPSIHICLGGAAITETAYRVKKNPVLWNFFDSIILGPGEESFSCLIHSIQTHANLAKVPNLIYKNRSSIVESATTHEFDLNNACCPEFPSLRPRNPVMLETASGCYWGKCIFCYYPRIGTNKPGLHQFKERDFSLVCKDVQELKIKYDPLFIGITDSSLHPNRLAALLDFNKKRHLSLKFTAFLRFETEFKSKNFCRSLSDGGFLGGQMGLESGSQRINDIINKGVRLNDAKKILRNFLDAGISVHLYSIIGVPGEKRKDAERTFIFFKEMHKFISLDWQIYTFTLMEKGPIAECAGNYGLTMHPLDETYLTQFTPFRVAKGLSPQESFKLSINYYDALKKYLHPYSKIMDIESYKLVIFTQKAIELSKAFGRPKYRRNLPTKRSPKV